MNSAAWMWVAIGAMALGGVLSSLYHSLRDVTRSALDELAVSHGRLAVQRRVEWSMVDGGGDGTAVACPRVVCYMVVAVAVVSWVRLVWGALGGRSWAMGVAVSAASLLLWVFNVVLPRAVATHAAEITVYT